MKTTYFSKLSICFLLSCVLITLDLSATDFITTWQTDITGNSNDDQITIPGTGTYTVNWEEVGNAANNGSAAATGSITITFPSAGTYQISIPSGLTRIHFNHSGDKRKLLTIEQWGSMAWTTMEDAFEGCRFMTYNAADTPDLSAVTSMAGMFKDCDAFNGAIGSWDVSKVENMSYLFYGAEDFNQNINNWDVSKVTDMSYMFNTAKDFNQPLNLWDVDTVTNMSYMFNNAITFDQDISGWNVMRVTNMANMFSAAREFDQAIGAWDVDSVTNMASMFSGAIKFNQAIGAWNVDSVTDMSSMFWGAVLFNQDISLWDVGSVTDMQGMFYRALAFNQNIGSWNVARVEDMKQMFDTAESFNQNIGGWNVAKVEKMNNMFVNATDFNQDIGSWTTSEVTDMRNMFKNTDDFNQDIGDWNVSKVVNMSGMFENTVSFNQDLSSWDFTNVTTMEEMFEDANAFNQSLGSWDISAVSDMDNMLDNSGLSPENYESTLIGWAAQTVPSGMALGASGMEYCDSGEAARNSLATDDSWSFVGDAKDCSTFPVELLSFTAQANGADVQVKWTTANETHNDYFIIERKIDEEAFLPIGQIKGAGNSSLPIDYAFIDRNPQASIVYYRLQQVDFDGSAERSNVVELRLDALAPTAYLIYPNPTQGAFTLEIIREIEQAHTYKIQDLRGITVQSGTLKEGINKAQIKVEALPAATYILQVENGKGQLMNLKLTVE
ncbi:MAG: BspA family leucine-rich repeat surface protein [Bacteroidota bacterium]